LYGIKARRSKGWQRELNLHANPAQPSTTMVVVFLVKDTALRFWHYRPKMMAIRSE
jgi:hypothetical protein